LTLSTYDSHDHLNHVRALRCIAQGQEREGDWSRGFIAADPASRRCVPPPLEPGDHDTAPAEDAT
jgi:hypothetical protein